MYNVHIIKQASADLATLDSKQVVKTAGVLNNIKNWLRSLLDPSFSEKVRELRNNYSTVEVHFRNLEKNLNEIEIAIKNGDAEKYNQCLDEIKRSSAALSSEINELSESSDDIQMPKAPKSVGTEVQGNGLPPGIVSPGEVLGGNDLVYSKNFSNSTSTYKALSTAIVNLGFNEEEVQDALNDDNFFKELRDATAAGEVKDVKYRDLGDKDTKNLNGDYIYTVFTSAFLIPKIPAELQAYVKVVDQRYNKKRPMNVKVMSLIIKVIPIKLGPTARARVKQAAEKKPWYLDLEKIKARANQYNQGNYISPKRTPISKDDFMTALRSTWEELFPDIQISQRGLDILWAKVALETGNFKYMYNYNLGNVKASPKYSHAGKWTGFKCGENLGGKSYKFTGKHPICYFAAFDNLASGIKFYLKTMYNYFKPALMEAVKGDPEAFAEKLHDMGYYTASPKAYTKGIKKLLGEYEGSETETQVSINEEIPEDIKDDVTELAQALGLQIAAGTELTDMVVNAIGEKMLPKHDVSIRIKAESVPTGMEYAYVLSTSILRTIDADVDVCHDGKRIEVNCNTYGGLDFIKDAVEEINNIVCNAFTNKYKKIVISTVSPFKSKLNIIADSKVDQERRKFSIKERLYG